MKVNRFKTCYCLAWVLVLVSSQPILSSEKQVGALLNDHHKLQELPGFFDDTSTFECTMEFDIKTFQKFKLKGNYFPARLRYYNADSVFIEQKFRIKARGNFRREHCSMPPFWLNIKKADIVATDFEGIDKVKIVTHCMAGTGYEQYVLKEYLAYKILNIVTPNSFRVRLLKIDYIDTGRKKKENTYWGFVIEPEETLAKRLEAIQLENDGLSIFYTDTLATDIMSMYQYMIGHTDFSVAGRHNLKLIKPLDPFAYYPIPIPYDLDYSGVVNAYYAVPKKKLPIEKVTERYFQGPCRTPAQYKEALQAIMQKEREIIGLINNFSYLNEPARKEMLSYIESFFAEARSTNFLKSLSRTCISPPVSP